MTDGIIQQTFDKHFIKQNYNYMISITDYNSELSILKQELIEKIKQTIELHDVHFSNWITIKTLIGDNQE